MFYKEQKKTDFSTWRHLNEKCFFTHFNVVEINLCAVRAVGLDHLDDLVDVRGVGRRVRVLPQLRGVAMVLVGHAQDVGHLLEVLEAGVLEEVVVLGNLLGGEVLHGVHGVCDFRGLLLLVGLGILLLEEVSCPGVNFGHELEEENVSSRLVIFTFSQSKV